MIESNIRDIGTKPLADFWESICSLLPAFRWQTMKTKKLTLIQCIHHLASTTVKTWVGNFVSSIPTLFKTFATLYHLRRSISNLVVKCFNATPLESNKAESKSRCYHLMAVYLKASYLIWVSLSLLLCTMLEIQLVVNTRKLLNFQFVVSQELEDYYSRVGNV